MNTTKMDLLLRLALIAFLIVNTCNVLFPPIGTVNLPDRLVASFHPEAASLAGGIKSVQQGTIVFSTETSKTATLPTSVNTAKAFVLYLGGTGPIDVATGNGHMDPSPYLQLTSGTIVTATRPSAAQGTSVTVGYMVVEFY